jgi:hypothetical protein
MRAPSDRGARDDEAGLDSTHIFLNRLMRRWRIGGSDRPALPPRLAAPSLRQRLTAVLAVVAAGTLMILLPLGAGPRILEYVIFLKATGPIGTMLLSLTALLGCLASVEWTLHFERQPTTISPWTVALGGTLGGLAAVFLILALDQRGMATLGTLMSLPLGSGLGAFAGTYPLRRRRYGRMAAVLVCALIVVGLAVAFLLRLIGDSLGLP